MARRSISSLDPPYVFGLRLLGSFVLDRVGQPLSLPTRKIESLLAYLVLHPQAHTRGRLATLFWGDSPEEQARISLRYAIAMLRKTLGADLLIADRETVQFNFAFPLWVDAIEFRQLADAKPQHLDGSLSFSHLQSAVSHYRGDLLADFYDDWIATEREHYRELYLATLLLLTQHYRSTSEYSRAIEMAKYVLQSDPANERAHQHIMFCFVALGDHHAALTQYRQCAAAMRQHLAVAPAPETIALFEWIDQARSEALSLAARITNLPIPLTSFIGRQQEMAEVKQLLTKIGRLTTDETRLHIESTVVRLLTLTGAGGSGKTRLAIQAATDLIDVYKDGVWWVELAALNDESLVPQAVAKALGVQESPPQPLLETLAISLRGKHVLLVLDNCEHLLDACAHLTRTVLSESENLRILATSREPLGFIGETVYVLPTLAFPDPNKFSWTDSLMQFEAIRLFVERAHAANSHFELNAENAPAVAQICASLDGIPLAIELAAARVYELSVQDVSERLDDRFRFLTQGNRGALPRQQTLHALIAWSHDLLSEKEQALFRRLAVFAGGWTLEAAEMVCSGDGLEPGQIASFMGQLIRKSLVLGELEGSKDRYGMLETIRQYAFAGLTAKDEEEVVRRRHAECFSRLALTESDLLGEYPHPAWLARVATDLGNLQTALTWVESTRACAHLRLGLAMILWQTYYFSGFLSKARACVASALATAEDRNPPEDRAEATLMLAEALAGQGQHLAAEAQFDASLKLFGDLGKRDRVAWVLNRLGWLAREYGDPLVAGSRLKESLALFRELEDRLHIAWVSITLGQVFVMEENAKEAKRLIEEGLTQFRSLGDTLGQAWALNHLGHVMQLEGEYARAAEVHRESLRLFGQYNRLGFGWCHHGLGETALAHGDPATAIRHLKDALVAFKDMGYQAGISWCLAGLAGAAYAEENYPRAAKLWGAAEALRRSVGSRKAPASHSRHQRLMLQTSTQLGQPEFDEEWDKGDAMDMVQVIEFALKSET